jgi:uncharacterized protein
MSAKSKSARPATRWYRGATIPMREIRKFVRTVADQFEPEKIILFGSYAYGVPHEDSDVDLLVVMPTQNPRMQAIQIRWAVPASFPLSLIVRTPRDLQRRLNEGDSFHTEIVTKGQVLYEESDPRMGP